MKGRKGTLIANSDVQALGYIARKVDKTPGTYTVGELAREMQGTLKVNVVRWLAEGIIKPDDKVVVKAKDAAKVNGLDFSKLKSNELDDILNKIIAGEYKKPEANVQATNDKKPEAVIQIPAELAEEIK